MRDNLIEHAEMARLSRELVELICDAPLPEPLDELALKGIPDEPLREFLEHHGFQSLLARLGGGAPGGERGRSTPWRRAGAGARPAPKPTIDRSLYETVTDEEALDRWIAEARRQGWSRSTPRPTGVDCVTAKLVGISLATAPNKACYIPLEHGGDDMFAERPTQLPGDAGAGAAEAAARGPGGPQDRPQSQIRLGHARPARHRRRAL